MGLDLDDFYSVVSGRRFRKIQVEKERGWRKLHGLEFPPNFDPSKASFWIREDLRLVFQPISKCGSASMVNYFRRLEADGQIFTRRKPIRLIWQLPPEKALAATGYR